ncbi:enoyl-CoA hydratase/isomerase family protein [Paraburkholderia sp. ZP32-5]|uniref:enoyl-CoA hydratase/isomerase family protein n=1 Tax=Paraburkholderia sp. ZP32-5 TaxID=2883245 RepID=UPI001F349562|nr:enoyl-CoA hydratase/isomerase family protein [Paraburkholderia sp. ZP32-5]
MSELVVVTRHPHWATIRLARATKRNALNREMRDALRAHLEALKADTRVIVLTGTDAVFCAGLDLKERETEKAAGQPDTAGEEAIELNVSMREHPAVFIAAQNGLALGAGVTLVNSCDLAIAADSATFGCPEIGFATYASMAGPTVQQTVQRRRAAWLLLTAERIDAATAERWGLINEVVGAQDLDARVAQLAGHIAQFDPVALREIKQALNRIPTDITGWRAGMEYGQTVNDTIRRETAAAAQGLAHFAQGGRNPGQG